MFIILYQLFFIVLFKIGLIIVVVLHKIYRNNKRINTLKYITM